MALCEAKAIKRECCIGWIGLLLLTGCGTHPAAKQAPYEPLAELQAQFGTLVTTGNHPTADQHGTGDRIGFFRDSSGTVWGLPLSVARDGAVVGCVPPALRSAVVTDEFPAASTIIGSTNEPTGWRGGTGKLELVLRNAGGSISVQVVSGRKLPAGPVCWAEVPPGPLQELFYYRLTPTKAAP